MTQFKFKAYDRTGKASEGVMEGRSTEEVTAALAQQGLIPISVSGMTTVRFNLFRFKNRVSIKELIIFTRQMWTLQRAGIPIEASLTCLKDQCDNPYFKSVIESVLQAIMEGDSLSKAFSHHPKVFTPIYVNMVKAGEASGHLDEVLFHLMETCEMEADTRDKIGQATRYPLITFFTLIVVFGFVVTFVIPKFSGLFSQLRTELPMPTRILMGLNAALREQGIFLLLAAAGFFALYRMWAATAKGRKALDTFKFRLPVIGKLLMLLTMARFSKILSELISSGLPILQAIQLVGETIDNTAFREVVDDLQEKISEGKSLSEVMRQSKFFSPMVVQMMAIGEQSGKTEELLRHVGGYYMQEANLMLRNLSTLIEPIMIVVIGCLVLLLALGVFLPTWDLVNTLH